MTRQISESVRIDLRGGGVLDSKTEYSRCRLPRLTVDMEEWRVKKKEEKKTWSLFQRGVVLFGSSRLMFSPDAVQRDVL